MELWRRNLVAIWFSQFASIAGFAFCMPFGPYFIQELGVTDPVRVKLWVGVFAAATPAGLAIFAPIWGILSDLYGRRIMMLRANFAAGIVLLLMGSVKSVEALVLLRFLQGAFTGTVTAAQTMVAVHTPTNRSGLALGSLSAAVFSGAMMGAFAGGLFAEAFGYRASFRMASAFLALAYVVVLFGTREDFERPEGEGLSRLRPTWKRPNLGPALPIVLLIMVMALVRNFDMALVALLVQDLHGSIQGVSRWTGYLFAVGSVAGLLSGFLLGHLADRVSPPRIAAACAVMAALAMVPHALTASFGVLFAARFAMMFSAGGLDPVFQIWLAKVTPGHKRGVVFGWAATAKSIGWIAAPLISGLVAAGYGIRRIYWVNAVLFLMLIPFLFYVVRWLARSTPSPNEGEQQGESP